MPTELSNISGRQDALTVFMDYRETENWKDLQTTVKEHFDPLQILYLHGKECRKSGEELYQFMSSKVKNYKATLPRSNRLVFCHYLRLNDLSRDWILEWQERVTEFQNRLPVMEAFQQYHMVCLSYESAETPLGEQRKEKADLVIQLGTELPNIAHVTYLLYTSGFDTLDRQQQGVAHLLYLLSRENTEDKLFPMQNRLSLKMLNYADYSAAKARMWLEKGKELKRWLTEESDPGQLDFLGIIKGALQGSAKTLRDAEENFESERVQIYPVHIDDFKKVGILPGSLRVSQIGSDHPIIQKRKLEYFNDLRGKFISEFNFEPVEKLVSESMFYQDLQNLDRLMNIRSDEEGSFENRIVVPLTDQVGGQAAGEIGKLVSEICENIRGRLDGQLSRIQEIYEEKQQERQHAQRELDIAGRYRDIRDCFANIADETSFRPIAGMFPSYQRNVCLIGSECYGRWYAEQYTIENVDRAYYCQDIDPTDAAFLKMGDLMKLNDEEAEGNLLRFL